MLARVNQSLDALFAAGILVVASACGSNQGGLSSPGGAATALAGNAGTAGDLPQGAANNLGGATGQGGNRFDTTNDTTIPTDPLVAARYQACMGYTQAQCQRRFIECGERISTEDPCITSLDRCPDLAFSPGSTWTEASLLSCAEAWRTFSCDDIRQNKRPTCAMPKGTRAVGEPCLFANQCATGNCSKLSKDGSGIANYPNCGVCGELLALGDACNRPGYDCAVDLTCSTAAGKCQTRATLGTIGSPCNDDSTCGGYGISCRADPLDSVKRCLTWPVAGEGCADYRCADGYTCGSNNVCASAPALGETCGSKGPAQCANGLVCSGRFDEQSNVCVAPRQLGEICLGDARRAPRGSCAVGLRCDCGEPDCDLKSGTCRRSRKAGETCPDKDSVCVPGTICSDGTCNPIESQPALSKLCPS